MSRLQIIEEPDPRLRLIAEPVERFDEALECLARDLVETLHSTSGIGLSAPQVGHSLQLLVVDMSEARNAAEIYINPQVQLTGRRCMVEESCLSLPGLEGVVSRVDAVRVRALNTQGQLFERDLEGMHAVCVQHEMDHLAGKLFTDRMALWQRLYMRGAAAVRAGLQRPAA
ncbi:MAG: peptide deformylase [Pseudomonadota bacterium]